MALTIIKGVKVAQDTDTGAVYLLDCGGGPVMVSPAGGSGVFYNTFYVNLETMSITGADHTFAEMKAAIDEGKYVVLIMDGTNTHIPLYEYADDEMVFNQSCIQGSESGLFLQVEVSPSEDEGGDDIWSVYTATVSDATSKIGDLPDLTTTSKSNLVAAINEVNGKSGGGEIFRLVFNESDGSVTHNGEVVSWEALVEVINNNTPLVLCGSGRCTSTYIFVEEEELITFCLSIFPSEDTIMHIAIVIAKDAQGNAALVSTQSGTCPLSPVE